jgi:diguanylate cyclase (GGDEF)-like protein
METVGLTSLFLLSSLHYVVILLVVVPLWLKERKRYRGISHWFAGALLIIAGQIILMSRTAVPAIISTVLANCMIIGGSLLYFIGCELFVGVTVRQLHNYLLLGAAGGLLVYFTFLQDNLQVRTIIASVALAAISFQCAYLLFFRTPPVLRPVTRPNGVILSLYLFTALSRTIWVSVAPGANDLLRTATADVVHLLVFETLGLALLFSTVLMLTRRLLAENEALGRRREGELHELEHLAMVDTVTGIYNRLKLEQVLAAEIQRAHRYLRPLSLILLDVDHYKLINDSFGHDVGDAVLKGMSRELLGGVRKVDVIGRWGGDEFLIISPETVLFGAANLAESLRKRIAKNAFGEAGRQTVSFGVAELKQDEAADGLLKRADDALYRAKQFGRNKVMWAG